MTPEAVLKADLRRQSLARRAALPPDVRARFSRRLTDEGLALALARRPESASAFYPVRDEPDTLALLAALGRRGVATALPLTRGRGETLLFRRWRPGDATFPGQLGIPEPSADAPALEPDLLFVPLAAFDRRGQRIGYGAGHYDRTLAALRARKSILAVGVAYSVCEVVEVPQEPHDQPLDYVLTDSELIRTR